MPQFAVHRNTNPATRSSVPFLLDVQSDLIEELGTRVVVPLYTVAAMNGKTLKVGERIRGVEVVAIKPGKVTLNWEGELRDFKVK